MHKAVQTTWQCYQPTIGDIIIQALWHFGSNSHNLTTCVKNLVLQNFCACPSAKSAFAKSLFPSGETSLKCHHPVPIRNLQFLLSKSSSLSLSFCYGWMMLISSFSMSRYCEDSDEGYFCQALLRIKAFWLCVRQRLPIRFISQEKILLQFYPFM